MRMQEHGICVWRKAILIWTAYSVSWRITRHYLVVEIVHIDSSVGGAGIYTYMWWCDSYRLSAIIVMLECYPVSGHINELAFLDLDCRLG